jgi:hypothetical protein
MRNENLLKLELSISLIGEKNNTSTATINSIEMDVFNIQYDINE